MIEYKRTNQMEGSDAKPMYVYDADVTGYKSGFGEFRKVRITKGKMGWDILFMRPDEFRFERHWYTTGYDSLKNAKSYVEMELAE